MTPDRFWLAAVLFHLAAGIASWMAARPWRDRENCTLPLPAWLATLAWRLIALAVLTYGLSLLTTVIANLDRLAGLRLGAISGRLMGQAIFGEAILLLAGLALWHKEAALPQRAGPLAVLAIALMAVYVDAYHVEPRMLLVQDHVLDLAGGAPSARKLRILHLSDLQAPVIGAHEERAFGEGLVHRPDLIVMTGDYVQDELGRPTEREAMRDLRALIDRIGFSAPLGVFATDGDAGPQCREVFAGTAVRCLVNESALVARPDGGTLSITGLSRHHGRERNPAWLAWLLGRAPPADHRLVISHAPDFVDALRERVDLVLAGHTHGGQVVLPFFGPLRTATRLPRRYAGGLHEFAGIPLHVSRGIGMERAFTPPVRFLCPPEICLIDLRLPLTRPSALPR